MAVATSSPSAAHALVKAVVLALILVLLAVAAGASSAEDGPVVAKSVDRFSETPVGRKLLQSPVPSYKLCGLGSAPDFNCKNLLPGAINATCCTTDSSGSQACFDVGSSDPNKCGSCTTQCKVGELSREICCFGVCANLMTDRNNCGRCRHRCQGTVNCTEVSCINF